MTRPPLPFRRPHADSRRGFTLTELLVVIGIIALLAGVLIPMVNRAFKKARETRVAADLQTVALALEAYKGDFGDYPRLPQIPVGGRTNAADDGSILLAWALLGPYPAVKDTPSGVTVFDGAVGPGFRVRPQTQLPLGAVGPGPDGVLNTSDDVGYQGRVYGPYIRVEDFKLGSVTVTASPGPGTATYSRLLDSYGNPILYFPARPGPRPDVRAAGTNWVAASNTALYDSSYSTTIGGGVLLQAVQASDYTGPFVLWSAGPDGSFMTADDATNLPPKK